MRPGEISLYTVLHYNRKNLVPCLSCRSRAKGKGGFHVGLGVGGIWELMCFQAIQRVFRPFQRVLGVFWHFPRCVRAPA